MAHESVTVNVKLDDAEVDRIVRMVAREVGRNVELALLNRNAELEERVGKLVVLALRLADEVEAGRRIGTGCWKGNFDGCDNDGCVKARELIAEARSYGLIPTICVCREPDPEASTHSVTCRTANGHNDDCPTRCPDHRATQPVPEERKALMPLLDDDKGIERPLVDKVWERDWDNTEDAVYDKE